MNKLILGSLGAAALILAACGGDDDPGTSAVDRAVDRLAAVVSQEGGTLDRDCAKGEMSSMSDADLQALIEGDLAQDLALGDGGAAVADALGSCITGVSPDTTAAPMDTAGATGDVDIAAMSTDELRDYVTELTLGTMAGVPIDEQCVRDTIALLPDEDLRAIAAAGLEGEPDISPEGAQVAAGLLDCLPGLGELGEGAIPDLSIPEGLEMDGELIDLFVEQLEQAGVSVDRACVEQALADVSVTELVEVLNDPALMSALTACVTA